VSCRVVSCRVRCRVIYCFDILIDLEGSMMGSLRGIINLLSFDGLERWEEEEEGKKTASCIGT